MDDKSTQALLVAQSVALGYFIIQKLFDYFLSRKKRKLEKQEDATEAKATTIDQDLLQLKLSSARQEAQLEIIMKQLFVVQEFEKDLRKLSEAIRAKL